MTWWKEFANRIELDASIGRQTWFRLGGCARFLFRPQSPQELMSFMRRAGEQGVSVKILGGGANVLVRDCGFDGAVVRLDHDSFRTVQWEEAALVVGAGVDLMPLARRCSERGLSGMECMAGIPGTVGGAVRMNAGGPSGELGDVVCRVDLLDGAGALVTRPHHEIGFAYRRTALDDCIVLSVRFELVQDDPTRVNNTFNAHLESKSQSQPLADKSAGCIFKNPSGVSAGALIDRAGLKGAQCGEASVSTRHANFIVAQEGATASDVLRLMDLVQRRVGDLFDIVLEPEIDVW